MREATADAARVWKNAMAKAVKLGADGKPTSIDGLSDTDSLLVSLCVFDVARNGPVPITVVRAWPNRVVDSLFRKIKEISMLEDMENEDFLSKRIGADRAKLEEIQAAKRSKNGAMVVDENTSLVEVLAKN